MPHSPAAPRARMATSARALVTRDDTDTYLGPISATPNLMVSRALTFACVSALDVVYDLGCNDGRVCVAAARDFGARALGVEIDASACALARERVERGECD